MQKCVGTEQLWLSMDLGDLSQEDRMQFEAELCQQLRESLSVR